MLSCSRDIELHLSSLGLGSKCSTTGSKISEVDLILNRAGKFAVREDEKGAMMVCPRHRKSLTTDWLGRKRTTCCYPNHKGEGKGNVQTKRANAQLSQEIFDLFDTVVPIGSGEFCVRILTLRKTYLITINNVTFTFTVDRTKRFSSASAKFGNGKRYNLEFGIRNLELKKR